MLRFSANIEASFLKTVVAVGPMPPVAANTNGDICNVFVYLLTVSNQKQPSCKKRRGPHKGHGEKRCEIQGGGQEMAVMVG